VDPGALRGSLGLDPLGTLAADGGLPLDLERLWDELAEAMAWARQRAPGLRVALVRGQPYHDGGGHAVHELGFALAAAAEVLGAMTDRGLTADEAADRLSFSFAAGPRLLVEVAKLRAARLLWSQLAGAFGCQEPQRGARIHVGSSGWQWSQRDVWVNILRGAAGAFAGVVGGADSVSVTPHDRCLGPPDAAARRLARGTQLVLREEAQLARLMDPAGGAWAVERLTDELARRAWALVQRVEAMGGMAAALRRGFPQAEVAGLAEARQAQIARGGEPAVGVTYQALVDEQRPEPRSADLRALGRAQAEALRALRAGRDSGAVQQRLDAIASAGAPGGRMDAAIEAASAGATLGELCRALRAGAGEPERVQPMAQRRVGEAFERLRDAADAGQRPRALLLHLAPPAGHRPRADFAAGFLALGGFAVSELVAPAGAGEAAGAVERDAPAAVVLCAPDAGYGELALAVAGALKARDPGRPLLLAGYPQERLEALSAAGVEHFIHQGSDRVAVLSSLQQALGVGR
jgi:methylmalonyl-CoA mutase